MMMMMMMCCWCVCVCVRVILAEGCAVSPRCVVWQGGACCCMAWVEVDVCRLSACMRCVWVQTDGATPLYAASWNGHVEVVHVLVKLGASVSQSTVRAWLCTAGMHKDKSGLLLEVADTHRHL